jgi:hypothetical protein
MPSSPIPELEPKRKPEPELKRPNKPEPEITQPTIAPKPDVGDDQGDSGPDRDNPITEQSKRRAPVEPEAGRPASVDPEDGHIGATESQVSDTSAPSGDTFKDEPRQG